MERFPDFEVRAMMTNSSGLLLIRKEAVASVDFQKEFDWRTLGVLPFFSSL